MDRRAFLLAAPALALLPSALAQAEPTASKSPLLSPTLNLSVYSGEDFAAFCKSDNGKVSYTHWDAPKRTAVSLHVYLTWGENPMLGTIDREVYWNIPVKQMRPGQHVIIQTTNYHELAWRHMSADGRFVIAYGHVGRAPPWTIGPNTMWD